jgi:flagellar biogenesis protein FliO
MPLVEQILAIAVVFGLLAAALWAAGRRGDLPFRLSRSQNAPPAVRVIQRLPLTPQHCLHVVKSQGAILLVGTHPAGIVFAPQADSFNESLRQALRGTAEVE